MRIALSLRLTIVLMLTMVPLVTSETIARAQNPDCGSMVGRNCSVVEPPSTPPGPGGGSGSGGGGTGGSGNGSGSSGNETGGGGGSGGGGLPDCVYEELGYICANLPGGSGGGEAPARPAPPTQIPESQFQTFDIPAPAIFAWPKDWAVVGKPAAFWTDVDVSYIDMTLLTYAVTVKVTPEKYQWNFGDDTGLTTTTKGAKPLPGAAPAIGHDFQRAGPTTVTMTTTFSGEFSVDGGPWLPIDGYAYVASNELSIDVYRFHRYLVDTDCTTDPGGPDCR